MNSRLDREVTSLNQGSRHQRKAFGTLRCHSGQGRVMLLTTHFMDDACSRFTQCIAALPVSECTLNYSLHDPSFKEAGVLGDRVAIMRAGVPRCKKISWTLLQEVLAVKSFRCDGDTSTVAHE